MSRSSRTGPSKPRPSYDGEGNTVKSILTNYGVRYRSTATANGKTLSTNYPLVFITYTDADIRVGLRNAYHVPREGVVLLDAGRLILDPATGEATFEAGQHEPGRRLGRAPSAATSSHRQRGCVTEKAKAPTDADRRYWLERFTLEEIRAIAGAVLPRA